jgi:hypothetical protein
MSYNVSAITPQTTFITDFNILALVIGASTLIVSNLWYLFIRDTIYYYFPQEENPNGITVEFLITFLLTCIFAIIIYLIKNYGFSLQHKVIDFFKNIPKLKFNVKLPH